jgi:hypothetical protein
MNWFLTIFIGILTAAVGAIGAGLVANAAVDWYHITSREGASGYFVVFMGLVGMIGGLIIGIVAARIVATGSLPGFFKGLGLAFGTTITLLAAIGGLAWLAADLPPKIDGKELELAVEVRCPTGFELPREASSLYSWYVSLTASHGSRSQGIGALRLQEATQVDGRWIIPATVFLHTSDPGKSLGVGMAGHPQQFFSLPLPSQPSRKDMDWSAWRDDPHFGNLSKPSPEAALAMRFRVQFWTLPPPPSQPTPAELEAQAEAADETAFRALTPDAPIAAWLRFTHYSKPQSRREAAAAVIAQRPNLVAEMSAHIRSTDPKAADVALRTVALLTPPPAGLGNAVNDVVHQIADESRAVNATTVEDDPSYERAAAASARFAGWTEAARTLHGNAGVDLLPVMQEILVLARVRSESIAMQDVVRVSSYYVEQWEGVSSKAPVRTP